MKPDAQLVYRWLEQGALWYDVGSANEGSNFAWTKIHCDDHGNDCLWLALLFNQLFGFTLFSNSHLQTGNPDKWNSRKHSKFCLKLSVRAVQPWNDDRDDDVASSHARSRILALRFVYWLSPVQAAIRAEQNAENQTATLWAATLCSVTRKFFREISKESSFTSEIYELLIFF